MYSLKDKYFNTKVVAAKVLQCHLLVNLHFLLVFPTYSFDTFLLSVDSESTITYMWTPILHYHHLYTCQRTSLIPQFFYSWDNLLVFN